MNATKMLWVALAVWAGGSFLVAQGQNARTPFKEGRQLQAAGKNPEAFLKYLEIPGGESAAAAVARSDPDFYKTLLREQGKGIPQPRLKLIEGDLWLAAGQKAEALVCYREVVARIGKTPEETWEHGYLPAQYYPVEANAMTGRNGISSWMTASVLRSPTLVPFALGPGSQRDNWLIRRFVALEAWDDAWLERFRQAGPEAYRVLLSGLMGANPQDTKVRLAWLEMAGQLEGGQAVSAMESLLDVDSDELLRP
jgi:hypothetical protein